MSTNWRNEVDPESYAAAQKACPMGHNGEMYAPCDDCLRKYAGEPVPWESRWLNFVLLDRAPGARTDKWFVHNKDNQAWLGVVKWHGAFRKYAFFPATDSLYDAACLYDVAHFMQLRMNERKEARARG